jgi:hypothetical protein
VSLNQLRIACLLSSISTARIMSSSQAVEKSTVPFGAFSATARTRVPELWQIASSAAWQFYYGHDVGAVSPDVVRTVLSTSERLPGLKMSSSMESSALRLSLSIRSEIASGACFPEVRRWFETAAGKCNLIRSVHRIAAPAFIRCLCSSQMVWSGFGRCKFDSA